MERRKLKKLKKLSPKMISAVEKSIKILLWECVTDEQRKRLDLKCITFPVNNPSYAEAFGVMRGLNALNYGYFGPVNLTAFGDKHTSAPYGFHIRNITNDLQNLCYWFANIKHIVREEFMYKLAGEEAEKAKDALLQTSVPAPKEDIQTLIETDLTLAIVNKQKTKVRWLKIVVGEMQRLPSKNLSDIEVVRLLTKLAKLERENLTRSEEKTSEYLETVEQYLPKKASVEEIKQWMKDNVDFSAFKNKMQAIKPILAHFGAKTEGNTVKDIILSL